MRDDATQGLAIFRKLSSTREYLSALLRFVVLLRPWEERDATSLMHMSKDIAVALQAAASVDLVLDTAGICEGVQAVIVEACTAVE